MYVSLYQFGRLSLATKFRLREKITSEIFYRRKYPDLRYAVFSSGILNVNLAVPFDLVVGGV